MEIMLASKITAYTSHESSCCSPHLSVAVLVHGYLFTSVTNCPNLLFLIECCMLHVLIGMVTDGEFNSLRTQGETRPVHIWQLIHDARESVSRQQVGTLVKMLKKFGGV